MNKTAYHFLPMLLLVSLFALPLQAQVALPPLPHLVFHAELGGSEAIPAVNTDAKGLVTLLFTPDRKKADVSGMLVKLDGTVTEAKIRLGITGNVGPVIFDLTPYINDRHIIGQFDVPAGLLEQLLINGIYVEVRTTAHPTGEIRGQFVCETDLDFGVNMTGVEAVPPNNTTARAFGGVHFPLGAHDILVAMAVSGLSGPITSGGIYEGQPGQNGVKLAKAAGFFGNVIQFLVDLDTIDQAFLLKAREGKLYIVLNTANFPNGEIRGQIYHLGYFASLAPINGVEQVPVPSPPTPGFGFSQTILKGGLDSLNTTLFISGIQPSTVKIHIGNIGQVGPEFVDMGAPLAPGFYSKSYAINESQLTDFAQGRLYINATTTAFPTGELRGRMKNTLRKAYAFDLCGIQMVPPVATNALGVAIASVDQANCYLNYKMIMDGLASTPIDGYFAIEEQGKNGTAFHSLNNTAPIIAGSHEIMAELGPWIEDDSSYVQISTTGHINGEIRGQVRRGFTCPEIVAVTELDNIEEVVVSPVPFQSVLNVTLKSASDFEGRLVMYDLLGIPALTQSVQIVAGEQTIEIHTRQLPKGVYTLSLEMPSQNASVLLKKVVRVE
jgi:hypothetical protein